MVYSYPPATDDSSDDSDSLPATLRARTKKTSRFERLLALKQELAALEDDLGNPSQTDEGTSQSYTKASEKEADPADLLKEIHSVRARLDKISAGKDGRTKLVDAVVTGSVVRHSTGPTAHSHGGSFVGTQISPTGGLHSPGLRRRENSVHRREGSFGASGQFASQQQGHGQPEADPALSKLDSRIGELEKLVGSSSAALDESAPLPPPLLPMLTRLGAQLTILTQPRTIDSISRRLKLLLTDLDRVATQNAAAAAAAPHGPQGSGHNRGASMSGPISVPTAGSAGTAGGLHGSAIQDQLTPILQRLAPHLPTLPHILARLRTLSSLHAAAADFQRGMEQVGVVHHLFISLYRSEYGLIVLFSKLEAQQAKNRSSLNDLEGAIKNLEKSMQENGEIEKSNVQRLEASVQSLLERLQKVEAS